METVYLPHLAEIVAVRQETSDVRSFTLHLVDDHVRESFAYRPGQFLEVSCFGVGEAPLCIASSPTPPGPLQVTVRAVGSVTNALHELGEGEQVGLRGPLGNHFPFDEVKGRNIVFVGGGIGLPPLRSLINAMLDTRQDFGRIQILYGARTAGDRVYKDELTRWAGREDLEYLETVDVGDDTWTGNVGVVTTLFEKTTIDPENTVAYTCGPPIMIRFVIIEFLKRGFPPDRIVTTLERYMKCGVGKCGHCAIGHRYVCTDGPVFTYDEIGELAEPT